MRPVLNVLSAALLIVAVGCGSGEAPQEVTPPAPTALRSQLLEVATSGELGSGASLLRDAIEQLKESDPTAAEALLFDMNELEGLSDPNQIKAKAQSMADKL
jgi:hypothetical protein